MYLESVELTNLRVFSKLRIDFDAKRLAGWHVLLGSNGSGKSSVLRALALALTGPQQAAASRVDIPRLVKAGEKSAGIKLQLKWEDGYDSWSGTGRTLKTKSFSASMQLSIDGSITPASVEFTKRTVWGEGGGWFSAAFGPYRRFSGGNEGPNVRLFTSFPKLARHLSVFGEDVALTEALEWLRLLRFKELEMEGRGDPTVNSMLQKVKRFINQDGFLPFGAKLSTVTSDLVTFEDGNGISIPVLEMSDGYRSILSMTFELLRLMEICYPQKNIFSIDGTQIVAPGIVLIDEIDVHLHPTWQRQIGLWFCSHFPHIQFIVTTHSPFICQQASEGSIRQLASPGDDCEERVRLIEGEELTRLLYGDASVALETPAFGVEGSRSDKSVELTEELASLNNKMRKPVELKPEEAKRRKELQELLEPVLSAEH